MPLGHIGARSALGAFRPSAAAVQEATTTPTQPIKINLKALEVLKVLSQDPRFETQVNAENKARINSLINGTSPEGIYHPYHAGLWKENLGSFLQQKLIPFQDEAKFAPGQQTIYGDVFNRTGAGVRNAIRELRKPETLAASKVGEFAGHDINIGLPAAVGAFKEGFARPRSIERYQKEDIENYYTKAGQAGAFDDYQRSAYLDSPGMQAMPQPIRSVAEHLDLLKNPSVAVGGTIASAKGLVKDIVTNPADLALMAAPVPKWLQRAGDIPIGPGFSAGVKNVFRPATRAGVVAGKEAIAAGLRGAAPSKAGAQMEFGFVKGLKPKPKLQAAPIIEKGGQQIFPFAKKGVARKPQGQLEFKFPKRAVRPQGQKEFGFVKQATKEGQAAIQAGKLDKELARVRPFSRQPPKGMTAAEVPLHPAEAGKAAAAQLPKLKAPRKVKLGKKVAKKPKPFKKIVAKKASQKAKKGIKAKLRSKKGQAEWSELTPEQQQAIVKSGMPLEKIDRLFGLKKKPIKGTPSKATPKIFKQRAPRPSKNLGRVAREIDSGNWGRIVKRTIEGGKETFEVTGGSFGDDVVKLTRDKVNILTDKTAAKLGEPVFDKPEIISAKPKPTVPKAPDPKAALRKQHASLQKQIISLEATKPTGKERIRLGALRQQYRKIGKQLQLSDAERIAAIKAGKKEVRSIQDLEGYESFAKPIKKLKEEAGFARIGKGKQPGKKADQAADDLVKAFKEMLPAIIDDVKQHGGTVMDRVKGLTDDAGKPLANEAVLKMVEKEVGVSAAAAKADITRHGNWNLKNLDKKLREAIVKMGDEDPSLTKKGITVTDPEVKKIAANLTDTPTMRAILKQKPGQLAAEGRKQIDDAAASLKAVLEEDFGPKGLMKQLQEVVKKRFAQQKEAQSRIGRTLRQNQLNADDEVVIKGLIQKAIDKYKKDPFLSPEDFKVIEEGLIKLQHDIFNTTKVSEFFDKAYYAWLNSLLSNPFTHGVNFMSNAMFLMEKVPNRAFDILGDITVRGIARAKGIKLDPVYKFKELPAMFRGFGRWAQRRIQKRGQPFKVRKGTKLDVDLPQPFSKSVNNVVGQPVSWLKKGDDIFKEAVGYMEFYARHVAGERGETLLSSIYEEQLHRTFQDTAGPLARWLLKGKKDVPGLKWIIPFVKTPERLLMRGLERTPIGAAGKIVRDLARGGTQKQIAHDIGLLYESALLTYGVGWLWHNSKITGDAPDNEAERAAFYESGKKPNSIKIGSHWIPFSRMEPIGTALALMVNFTQDVANSEKEYPIDKIIDGIGGITQTLANKTYFSGVLGFMRAAAEPQIYGGRLISKFIASGAPGLLKFAADIIDPVYRKSEGAVEEVAKRVPFASKTVEPTLGVFGDEQLKTFLGIGKEKTDRLTKALADTPVPMPSDRLGGEKLTSKEYNDILRKSGPFLKQTLLNVVSSPGWDAIPRGLRARVVENAARQIRGAYRDELLMKKIMADPQALIDKYLK